MTAPLDSAQQVGALDRVFWRGRRVFITGHTGFKGSWLSLWLEALGASVTGYSLEPPTSPNLFEQAAVGQTMRTVLADVRDLPSLTAALRESAPDVVLHMAAQSVVKQGYADPVGTYAVNVMGTVNLLEAVRILGRPCAVVVVTSDKCYDHNSSGTPYHESDAMGGDDPYSNSKGCAELVTLAYRRSYFPVGELARHGVAVATARAGNAIGGGDWTADQLIPDLIRGFSSGNPCLIRNPAGIRPWQFVLEPLRGYLMIAEHLAAGRASFASSWNFGPAEADARPVAWIADHMVAGWGGGAAWIRDAKAHPAEAAVLRLDTTKASTELGWSPALPLRDGLDWITEWYQAWRREADVGRVTRSQIHRYEELLS